MYFSGHLLDDYSKHIEALDATGIADILSDDGVIFTDRQPVMVAGIVGGVTHKTTKNGARMAFFDLDDKYGEIECVVFSKQFENYYQYIRTDEAVAVEGNLSIKEDGKTNIIVSRMSLLSDNSSYKEEKPKTAEKPVENKTKKLYLRVPSRSSREFLKCENLAELMPGALPVWYFDDSEKKYFVGRSGINFTPLVKKTLEDYLGKENVVLK